jgi:hypothetical protein
VHNLDLLGGFTQQVSETKGNVAGASGFVNDILTYNDLSSASTPIVSSSYSGWTLESFLGRLNYNYDHKYFLSASFRADGSSRLGPNNKWGYFPSGSFGWQFDKETFLKNTVNSLKITSIELWSYR